MSHKMKILYVTDLHGNKAKYRQIFEIVKKNKVGAVVNGGDMLCLEDDLHQSQREFIEGFLCNKALHKQSLRQQEAQ